MQAVLAGLIPLVEPMPEANTLLDMPHLLALAAALGWASGFRLYAALFLTGAAGYLGWMPLPPGLHVLEHPAVLAVSGLLCATEFFADKLPKATQVTNKVFTIMGPISGGDAHGIPKLFDHFSKGMKNLLAFVLHAEIKRGPPSSVDSAQSSTDLSDPKRLKIPRIYCP